MEVTSTRAAEPSKPVQASRRAEEAKEARATEARATEARTQAQELKKANEPKPMVNTQGQQTGRLLNVTA